MEPILKTRFPLNPAVVQKDIFKIISTWISQNRSFNAAFDSNVLEQIVEEDSFKIHGKNSARIEKVIVDIDSVKYSSFCFIHPLNYSGEFLENTICVKQDSDEKEALATVVLNYGTNYPVYRDFICRKPVIINMLIDNLSSVKDSWLDLKTTPHVLENDGPDAMACSINREVTPAMLPLVFVSRMYSNNDFALNPLLLAKKLGGFAHVIAATSSEFSRELSASLKDKDNSCYDGAVRIYWPNNKFKSVNQYWTSSSIAGIESTSSSKDIYQVILEEIIKKTKSINMRDCSHDYISILNKKKQIHARILQLQSQVSESETKEKNNSEVMVLYEQVIDQLESEKSGLNYQVQKLSEELDDTKDSLEVARSNLIHANQNKASSVKLELKIPSDLLLIVDSFSKKQGNIVAPYFRERAKEFLASSESEFRQALQERESAINDLSNAFNSYSRLNSFQVKTLHKHGFTYTEDGSHYKIFREGFNPDICVVLAKTPSDHRCGKNFLTELKKAFYYL